MTGLPETQIPTPDNPNVLSRAVTHITIAYEGIRATISEARAARADKRASEADNDAEFYAALSSPVLDVVIGEPASSSSEVKDVRARDDSTTAQIDSAIGRAVRGANMPHAPSEKNPLTKQAQSHKNMRTKSAAGSYDLPTSPGIQPTIDVQPRSGRQRRAATRVARELNVLRDERKSQARRAKIFGNSGQVSELRTSAHAIGLALSLRRAYRDGSIDAFEREQRRQQARSTIITNEPHILEETGHLLTQIGDETISSLGSEIHSATRRSKKARGRAASHRSKASARRQKQQQAIRKLHP